MHLKVVVRIIVGSLMRRHSRSNRKLTTCRTFRLRERIVDDPIDNARKHDHGSLPLTSSASVDSAALKVARYCAIRRGSAFPLSSRNQSKSAREASDVVGCSHCRMGNNGNLQLAVENIRQKGLLTPFVKSVHESARAIFLILFDNLGDCLSSMVCTVFFSLCLDRGANF